MITTVHETEYRGWTIKNCKTLQFTFVVSIVFNLQRRHQGDEAGERGFNVNIYFLFINFCQQTVGSSDRLTLFMKILFIQQRQQKMLLKTQIQKKLTVTKLYKGTGLI